MTNVTLSADEHLIEQARLVAKSQNKTLNAAFHEWLLQYTAQAGDPWAFKSLMTRLVHIRPGRRFKRDELDAR